MAEDVSWRGLGKFLVGILIAMVFVAWIGHLRRGELGYDCGGTKACAHGLVCQQMRSIDASGAGGADHMVCTPANPTDRHSMTERDLYDNVSVYGTWAVLVGLGVLFLAMLTLGTRTVLRARRRPDPGPAPRP